MLNTDLVPLHASPTGPGDSARLRAVACLTHGLPLCWTLAQADALRSPSAHNTHTDGSACSHYPHYTRMSDICTRLVMPARTTSRTAATDSQNEQLEPPTACVRDRMRLSANFLGSRLRQNRQYANDSIAGGLPMPSPPRHASPRLATPRLATPRHASPRGAGGRTMADRPACESTWRRRSS